MASEATSSCALRVCGLHFLLWCLVDARLGERNASTTSVAEQARLLNTNATSPRPRSEQVGLNTTIAELALGGWNTSEYSVEDQASFVSRNVTSESLPIEEGVWNTTLEASVLGQHGGYEYMATTTRYGDAAASACGAMDTAALVAGTGYYNVASAQAMQGGDCCWCGKSNSRNGHSSGTAPMGCLQCAKGRFIRRKPNYGRRLTETMSDSGFASAEIHLVVGDLCPHVGNEHWCPAQPGQTNAVGSKNHFDFSHPPAGIDNNYFVFTPVECSPQLKQRMSAMSRCQR